MPPPGRPPIIGVVGSGDPATDPATLRLAYAVGQLLAQRNCVLLTGGRAGVMAEASRGAADAGALVLGLLPGTSPADANPHVTLPILTGLGEARNAILAHTAAGLIALTPDFGTLSEIAFALKFNKPVVSLHSWSIHPAIHPAHSPEEAVDKLLSLITPRPSGAAPD